MLVSQQTFIHYINKKKCSKSANYTQRVKFSPQNSYGELSTDCDMFYGQAQAYLKKTTKTNSFKRYS